MEFAEYFQFYKKSVGIMIDKFPFCSYSVFGVHHKTNLLRAEGETICSGFKREKEGRVASGWVTHPRTVEDD